MTGHHGSGTTPFRRDSPSSLPGHGRKARNHIVIEPYLRFEGLISVSPDIYLRFEGVPAKYERSQNRAIPAAKALNTSDIAFGQPPEMQIDVPDPSDQPLEM